MAIITSKDTILVCRNSQGTEFHATLLRLTRYTVVFEVYNPYSIVQLSEVLTDFRIIMNDRMVYSGRAVVSNLVNTGILLISECTLEDSWLDIDLFSSIHQKDRLKDEFSAFLKEWEKIHHVSDHLKVVIADMQTYLMDMRRWLEQVEIGIQSEPSADRSLIEKDAILELKDSVVPAVGSLFERFEQTLSAIPADLHLIHRSYSRRQIHPLVLCSPFVYRSFQKPLGYAGDYEMVNMMLREPFEGSSLFAKILNTFFLSAPPCEAHRNRIKHLKKTLTEETERSVREKRKIRILDMGCGPAKEIQEFIALSPLSDHAEFDLMDFNDETLEHTSRKLDDLKTLHKRETSIRLIKKSVNHILKESFSPPPGLPGKTYHLIYCAGLFDYLEDRICKRMMNYFYDRLEPGGLLLATNVTPSNPVQNVMESFMEWHLIYRNGGQMATLKPDAAPAESCASMTEATGVNVFLEVRKPLQACGKGGE